MKRRTFLKGLAGFGAALVLPFQSLSKPIVDNGSYSVAMTNGYGGENFISLPAKSGVMLGDLVTLDKRGFVVPAQKHNKILGIAIKPRDLRGRAKVQLHGYGTFKVLGSS